VAHPHRTYQPRDTDHSVPHAVIREHLEPFLREVSDRGDGRRLPRFVGQEFREFLTCGGRPAQMEFFESLHLCGLSGLTSFTVRTCSAASKTPLA